MPGRLPGTRADGAAAGQEVTLVEGTIRRPDPNVSEDCVSHGRMTSISAILANK